MQKATVTYLAMVLDGERVRLQMTPPVARQSNFVEISSLLPRSQQGETSPKPMQKACQ